MIDLDTILSEWKEDSQIPKNQLDEASRKTPELHHKYLSYLSAMKLRLKRSEFEQKNLLKDKWLYYEGKMSQEDIESRGWKPDPYDGLLSQQKVRKKTGMILTKRYKTQNLKSNTLRHV